MSLMDKLPYIKQRINEIADEVKAEGWIDDSVYRAVINSLKSEKITIGIVGQMKYGKSTLLNALIFGNQVLPSASTPMTASLTYLTYGKGKTADIEFYSADEWKKLEKVASDNKGTTEADAAKELIQKAALIKREIPDLLGKSKTVDLEDIMHYVGESGKYVPITKALTIKYPAERLNGIDFIDTPGFNDPVASREQRASESLSKADVIVVLLYAGRPFDKTDKDIIFKKLKMTGAGKVVVVLNKYDILLDDYGTEARVLAHIGELWKKEVEAIEEGSPIRKIFDEAHYMPFSSLMALLGKLSKDAISKDDDLKYHYDQFIQNYPAIKTADDFINMSKLPALEAEIDHIIKKEKIKILVQKPIASITGAARQKLDSVEAEILKLELELNNLSKSRPEIEQEKKNFDAIKKETKNKIKTAVTDLSEEIGMVKRDNLNAIEKEKNEMLIECSNRIPDKAFMESTEDYLSRCRETTENILLEFRNTISDLNNDCVKKMHQKLKMIAMTLDAEIDSVVSKHINYESRINDIRTKFQQMIESQRVDLDFAVPEINIPYDNIIVDILNVFIPFFKNIVALFRNPKGKVVNQIRGPLEENLSNEVLFAPIEGLAQKVVGNLAYLEQMFEESVLKPIEDALKDAAENLNRKEERCNAIEKELEALKSSQEHIKNKILGYEREMLSFIEGD